MLFSTQPFILKCKVCDLDIRTDIKVQCLFKGKAKEQLKSAAPYLIDLSLDESSYTDDSRISRFHRDQFPELWQRDSLLFIKTSSDIDQLCDYLRRFTKISIGGNNPQFFRFWEPTIARYYFNRLLPYQARVAKWFGCVQDSQLINEIIYRGESELSCIKIVPKNIDPDISMGGFNANSDVEQRIFNSWARDRFIAQIAPWVTANFTAHSNQETDNLHAFYGDQILKLSDLGIRSQRAVSLILAAIYQSNHPVQHWHESLSDYIQQTEMSQEMKAQQIAETLIQSLNKE